MKNNDLAEEMMKEEALLPGETIEDIVDKKK